MIYLDLSINLLAEVFTGGISQGSTLKRDIGNRLGLRVISYFFLAPFCFLSPTQSDVSKLQ